MKLSVKGSSSSKRQTLQQLGALPRTLYLVNFCSFMGPKKKIGEDCLVIFDDADAYGTNRILFLKDHCHLALNSESFLNLREVKGVEVTV